MEVVEWVILDREVKESCSEPWHLSRDLKDKETVTQRRRVSVLDDGNRKREVPEAGMGLVS